MRLAKSKSVRCIGCGCLSRLAPEPRESNGRVRPIGAYIPSPLKPQEMGLQLRAAIKKLGNRTEYWESWIEGSARIGCFSRVWEWEEGWDGEEQARSGDLNRELTELRECTYYTEYIPGLSPRDHIDRRLELIDQWEERAWETRQKLVWWFLGILSMALGGVIATAILHYLGFLSSAK